MFSKFGRSWALLRASWDVLRTDGELIVFPIVSLICTVVISLTFLFPMALTGIFEQATSGRAHQGANALAVLVGFLYYVVLYTAIYFCNSALVAAVMMRLHNEKPSLGAAFNVAFQHIGAIIGYAIISATVGMILRSIAERTGIIGRIVVGLIGFTWSVVTYLVVPVLVMENVNPVDGIKRSAELLKKTWGEQLAGGLTMGAAFGLIFLAVSAVFVALIGVLVSAHSVIGTIVVAGVWILALIVLGLVSSALQGIFNAALYDYAVTGNTGGMFDDGLLQGAFRHK